jgi:hypothetical protein
LFIIIFILKLNFFNFELIKTRWGLGIGDWGLGIGDWAQYPKPNPQYPEYIFKIKIFLVR